MNFGISGQEYERLKFIHKKGILMNEINKVDAATATPVTPTKEHEQVGPANPEVKEAEQVKEAGI